MNLRTYSAESLGTGPLYPQPEDACSKTPERFLKEPMQDRGIYEVCPESIGP